jgi:hypothetical protein
VTGKAQQVVVSNCSKIRRSRRHARPCGNSWSGEGRWISVLPASRANTCGRAALTHIAGDCRAAIRCLSQHPAGNQSIRRAALGRPRPSRRSVVIDDQRSVRGFDPALAAMTESTVSRSRRPRRTTDDDGTSARTTTTLRSRMSA